MDIELTGQWKPGGDRWQHLHVVESTSLTEYLRNTKYFSTVSHQSFAAHILGGGPAPVTGIEHLKFNKPFVLYHSWLPDWLCVSERDAEAARKLLGLVATREADGDVISLAQYLNDLGWATSGPPDLDQVVERSQDRFIAIQNRFELRAFMDLVADQKPRTVVEIGTARGGMLYSLGQISDANGLLVSIDLPGGRNCGGQTPIEREVFSSFRSPNQLFAFLPANSHFYTTRVALAELLDRRPIDLLFIDGDHSYGGVRADFEMYRELVAADGLIALHDINILPEDDGPGSDVGKFWTELRARYPVREFIDPGGATRRANCRDGVPRAWGIGVLHAADVDR